MTAQASDTVIYRDRDYKLAHDAGTGLLNVFAALGYRPHPTSTACYAGYIAGYSIIDGWLFLSNLEVGLPDEFYDPNYVGEPPKLFGVSPDLGGFFGANYEGLSEPMPFTGGLILGNGFIWDLYEHSGSHPAWKYERVYEVIFDSGQVVEEHDRSASMAEHRTNKDEYRRKWRIERPFESLDTPEVMLADINALQADIADMYADCFSLDYGLRQRRR